MNRRTRPDNRSTGLDAFRAAACLIVVAFHLHSVARVSFGPLDPFIQGGDTGVYVFFALSGYLLYRPFLSREVDLGVYGIKRAARILPAYYVSLVALTILTGNLQAARYPLAYLTIASSYSSDLRSFLGSAWTLSAEVIFYVSLPWIARAAAGREFRVLGAMAAVSTAILVVLFTIPGDAAAVAGGSFPAIFGAFVPGMVLAVVEVRHPAAFHRLALWPYPVLGLMLIVLGTTHGIPIALDSSIGAALVMGWLLHRRVPGGRAFAFLGGMSYALYLWHTDLILTFGAVGAVIAVIGAAASWVLVERPILNWAHRFSRQWIQRPVEAPAA